MGVRRYTTGLGQQLTLAEELGKGGEGTVWRIQGVANLVAKVYHHDKRTPAQEAKLRAMLAAPPEQKGAGGHVAIAWPLEILYSHGRLAGFTMHRIRQCPDIFQIYNPRLRREAHPACDRRFLHRTAYNLAVAVHLLHATGYVIGDVNQKNILVTGDAQVTLIDTDSFQVRDPASGLVHRCLVATPEYLPPELQGQPLDRLDRDPCHDLFGLAVLLFQLLMEGRHPCVGVPLHPSRPAPTEPREWIRAGVFPYTRNPDYGPPPSAPEFTLLHPELQALFLRAFVNGIQSPAARPSAREWHTGLKTAEDDLLRCGRDAEHWYYGANGAQCPLCPMTSVNVPPSAHPSHTGTNSKPQPYLKGRSGGWKWILLVMSVSLVIIMLYPGIKKKDEAPATAPVPVEAPAPPPVPDAPLVPPKISMIKVKGDCFQMGDTFDDGGSDEKPVHEVCVDSFRLGKYEVTQGQWQAVMGSNPSHFSTCGDDCPVEKVSWDDAQEFIKKLNSLTGENYRLPTEAEWEYAARSGGKGEKYSGGNDVGAVAWYSSNSGDQTHPVGLKQANGLGFYDMCGNVWEWTADWYDSDYYGQSPRSNPQGPSSGTNRALRGGSWGSDAGYMRAVYRDRLTPNSRGNSNGFRLAASVQ